MPPKTAAAVTTGTGAITSVATLRAAFANLALHEANLPQHQSAFAVDVVATYPDLAQLYTTMFGDKRTDLGTMARQAVDEGRYTISSGLESSSGGDLSIATRARKAVDLFLADCQIIHDNCAAFNGTANNLPQLAAEMLDAAKKRGEILYKKLIASPFLNNIHQNKNNNNAGAAATATTTATTTTSLSHSSTAQNSVARGNTNAPNNNNFNIRQREEEITTIKKEEVASREQHAISLQDLVRQTAEQYKNDPLVSGPLAVTVPQKIQERIVAQHVAYVENCKSTPANANNKSNATIFIPPLSSSSSSSSIVHENNCKNNNLVIDVLLDFFASFCAKNLGVSKEDVILKKFLLVSKQDLILALETSEITNPRNFLQQQEQKTQNESSKKDNATSSEVTPRSNRKIEQYWAVLARVILPWFNATAMVKFLYLDERIAALSQLVKLKLPMTGENKKFGHGGDGGNDSPLHKVLHFDILVRSLLELPLVASTVLSDTLDRASNNNNNNNNNNMNTNHESVASSIVHAAVVPVVNDLLEFIAQEKI